MDDGDYTAQVTPLPDHDVAAEEAATPTTVQLTISGVTRTDWTASVNGSQPVPASGPGRVQVQIADDEGMRYVAAADYDPSRTPHLTGVGPFTAEAKP